MSFSFAQFADQTKKALDQYSAQLNKLRTGRATVSILDPVRVEAYGTYVELSSIAKVAAPDAQTLVVKPYDPSQLEAVEKAIRSAELNLNPSVNQDQVIIPVPPLTQERRQDLIKMLHKEAEQAKVIIRTIRTETKQDIEAQEGQDGVSEDQIKSDLAKLEDEVKNVIAKIDQMTSQKETDLKTL